MATQEEIATIRRALSGIDLTESSHLAANEPAKDRIFSPHSHASALDFSRSLVVGNRGVGKSFWSAVLAHNDTRIFVSSSYPRLSLDKLDVHLGFHEAAGKRDDFTPSATELQSLLAKGREPEDIWRAVLLRIVAHAAASRPFASTTEAVEWSHQNPLEVEAILRKADTAYSTAGKRLLIIFDALDRLGRDWNTIRRLTEGVIRLALDMRGYRALRAKIFMRVDQASDDGLFRFPDASKLRTEQVKLVWERRDLYGMLFQHLWSHEEAGTTFRSLVRNATNVSPRSPRTLPPELGQDEVIQAEVFYALAGEFMGADARRGRTYSWLHGHLGDTFEETSPRSFLTAIRTAANYSPPPSRTVIDASGLKAGVQSASEIRVQQLKEDYEWIDAVLKALQGLEVPCPPKAFTQRWKDSGTITEIERAISHSDKLAPVEFENNPADKYQALLVSLETLGVIERRAGDKINMPDLFRVEARIKRRGGVKPPAKPR